jgi:glycosyltransferase involved in cell wall biosynthesis
MGTLALRRRPRVLIVITLAETGGAQTYVASLLPALAAHFDVVVAAHGPGPLRNAARIAGVRFIGLRHVRRPISLGRDLLGLVELISLLRRERPDVLHVNSSKAGILARLAAVAARVPIRIFTVHGWAFEAFSGLPSLLFRWADRLTSPLTTVTICVGESERAAGLQARTCRADRTVVIANAVDVSAAPQANHAGNVPRIITVGRLRPPKDPVTLARALARLQAGSFSATVVGDGPSRPAFEAEIRRLGLAATVDLAGDRRDVADLLAAADIFVLSSVHEGQPLSIVEAMAAGLPVVATAVGGVPELVVNGETGLLVPKRKADELAAALARLVHDPALRRRLGEAGRARAEALFDLPSFRRAHVDLYRRELAKRGLPLAAE